MIRHLTAEMETLRLGRSLAYDLGFVVSAMLMKLCIILRVNKVAGPSPKCVYR
jgi:hypothetical protein